MAVSNVEGSPGFLQLSNSEVELTLATSFGPRILGYALRGGSNVLAPADVEVPTALGTWRARGGHRLWMAPERMPESYEPDDRPVRVVPAGELGLELIGEAQAPVHIEKRMRVSLRPTGTEVEVAHTLINRGGVAVRGAPWALSILQPGGRVIIPQEPIRLHSECFDAARPLVLWHFTDLSDSRFSISREQIVLRNDPAMSVAQKIGCGNRQGWAAYEVGDLRLTKRFAYDPTAQYPDFGCNCEAFTAGAFIELESLGPLVTLEPGAATTHLERWSLALR